jgi:hypothetical protein
MLRRGTHGACGKPKPGPMVPPQQHWMNEI